MKFLKENYKFIITLGGIAIIAFLLLKNANTSTRNIEVLSKYIETSDSITQVKLDSLEQRVLFSTSTKQIDKRDLAKLARINSNVGMLSERLKSLGTKLDKLQSSTTFMFDQIGSGRLDRTITTKDSVFVFQIPTGDPVEQTATTQWKFKDKYLEADVYPTEDSGFLTYSYNPGKVSLDVYKKKTGLFKHETRAALQFENPNTKLSSSNTIVTSSPKLTGVIGIGIGGGAMYTNNNLKFGPVVSLTYTKPIFKFYKKNK
jgi:hypothetical protein